MKQRKDGKVLVDPRILEAGMKEIAEKKAEIEADPFNAEPLITGDGTAELGEGILFDYDQESETIVVRMGNEKKKMTKLELWQFVFGISSPKMRDALIPVRQVERVTYHRIHTVALKKDMRAGQKLRVKCEMNVEQSVVEGLKGMMEQHGVKQNKAGLILPL